MAVHNSSAVELNWKPIALRYLRGWACYDLLTAIPWWRVVYNVDVSELIRHVGGRGVGAGAAHG